MKKFRVHCWVDCEASDEQLAVLTVAVALQKANKIMEKEGDNLKVIAWNRATDLTLRNQHRKLMRSQGRR